MAAPTPITPLPEAPQRSQGPVQFNATSDPFIAALPPMVVQVNASLTWMYSQGLLIDGYRADALSYRNAAQDAASAAAQSAVDATSNGAAQVVLAAAQVGLAVAARQGSEAARDQSQAYAQAAQAGTVPTPMPNTALTADSNGVVAWRQVGQAVGDTLKCTYIPDASYLPANGGIYLKSAYPALAAKIGLIDEKNFGTTYSSYAAGVSVVAVDVGKDNTVWALSNTAIRKSVDGAATWATSKTMLSGRIIKSDTKGTVIAATPYKLDGNPQAGGFIQGGCRS